MIFQQHARCTLEWICLEKFSRCHTDQKLYIKAATSSSHCIQTPSQPVLALTQKHPVSGRVTTRVRSLKSWRHSYTCQYQQLHAIICGISLVANKQRINRKMMKSTKSAGRWWRARNQHCMKYLATFLSNIAKHIHTMILPRKHFSFQFKHHIYTFHSFTAVTLAHSHNTLLDSSYTATFTQLNTFTQPNTFTYKK